jgi:geranylgeranyl diphosphate synthase type II
MDAVKNRLLGAVNPFGGRQSPLMTDDLFQYLSRKRVAVEGALRAWLRLIAGGPANLRAAVEYSLLAPGKRLRPILVLLAADACGGSDEVAMPAACAVEMVHAYSLIHDDLPAMDDDDVRRGQPTCHKEFGEALAILAGDALLTLAFHVLAEGMPAPSAVACCRELARGAGAAGMVGGQVADLQWDGRIHSTMSGPPTLSHLQVMHGQKTGELFVACLRMGCFAAYGERRPDDRIAQLEAFGRSFGQLFQVTDDLLDAEGLRETTGKNVRRDAARGKLTYPALLGPAESRKRAADLCAEAQRHVSPLGTAGERLAALADYVVYRDR